MSAGWPAQEAAQADYETLRAAVLAGTPMAGLAARRFAVAGLAGLIARPVTAPVFAAAVIGARRPPWCGDGDPRMEALTAGYGLLLAVDVNERRLEEIWA